jgi:hypothetical protein
MKKNQLLSAVGGAALVVASHGALASVPLGNADFPVSGAARIADGSGLVVEFLARIGGGVSPDTIQAALNAMFPALTQAQAEKLPALMLNIRGLGWSSRLEAAAGEAMVDLLAGAPALADQGDVQMRIAALIGVSVKSPIMAVRVAQAAVRDNLCVYRPNDPRRRLDPDCPPLETGSLAAGPPRETGSIGGY